MIFKKIEVLNYEIQTKIFAVLLFLLVLVWLSISFMFFLNRHTYSNKRIDIKYFHSNLSKNTIKAIVPASSILDGDNFIIENYLAEYVKTRETHIPQDFLSKDAYVTAFTESNLFSVYLQQSQRYRMMNPFLLRHVYIQRIIKLDDTLYQVHYFTTEKQDYRTSLEVKKQMISTLRYDFAEIPEYDIRLKIKSFELLNPLKIEISVYTTARRYS